MGTDCQNLADKPGETAILPARYTPWGFGGARRDRTADLLHAMQALSQLSYGPKLQILTEINRFRVKNRRGTLRDSRVGVKPKSGSVVPVFVIPNEPIRIRSGQAPRGGILL